MPKPDSIHSLMLARFRPKTGVELLDIPFADPEAIAALNTPTAPYSNSRQPSLPPRVHGQPPHRSGRLN
jgi:hypothetical protein